MKNLELESMGVQEMDATEMKNVDGGDWLDVVMGACCGAMCAGPGGAIVGAIAAAALSDW